MRTLIWLWAGLALAQQNTRVSVMEQIDARVQGFASTGVPSGVCKTGRQVYTDLVDGSVYWCKAAGWVRLVDSTDIPKPPVPPRLDRTFWLPFAAGFYNRTVPSNHSSSVATQVYCENAEPYRCYVHANSSQPAIYTSVPVPVGWSGKVTVGASFRGSGAGNRVQFAVAAGCGSPGEPVSMPARATVGLQWTTAEVAVSPSGCSPSQVLYVKLSRADSTGWADIEGLFVRFE